MYLIKEEAADVINPEEHLGLVRMCAGKFNGKGIEYEELYSAGCIGLLKAVKGFDSSRGVRFSTYAVPVILGEMKQLFRDGGSVKVSRSLKEKALRLGQMRERFEAENLREPSISELAEVSGMDRYEVAQAMCVLQPTVSLTLYDREERQSDIPLPSHESEVIEHLALQQVLTKLSDDDRQLIEMRFFNGMTQEAVAAKLGRTQVQVSRRERRILSYLRSQL